MNRKIQEVMKEKKEIQMQRNDLSKQILIIYLRIQQTLRNGERVTMEEYDENRGLMAQDAVTALVRELALQSQLLGRDAGHWQLRVERETLNHAASRERLQTALQAAGHGDVKLGIEIGPVTDSPARRLAVKAAEKMVAAQELIQNDPLVQAMVRDFGAKIVPGSIQII
jgi:DNA polymerase-3 subunit gamma/tau